MSISKYLRTLPVFSTTMILAFTFAISAPVLVAGHASAETFTAVVVPNSLANVEGNQQNRVPFTVSGGLRYQQVYAASEFSAFGGPVTIIQIVFRPDAGSSGGEDFSKRISSIDISLSTTAAEPDGLSATFSDNIGSDNTLVYSGSLVFGSGWNGSTPKEFDAPITLTTPFTYDPSAGNLLLDVKNKGPENNLPGGALDSVDAADGISSVRSAAGDPDALVGSADTRGKVTRFVAASVLDPLTVLVSGPQQREGGALVDVPDPAGGFLALGQILVNHNRAQFYSFEISLANNSGQTVSRVFSDAIGEIFNPSGNGEDASDGTIDRSCDDGTCDGIMLEPVAGACTVQALDSEDVDKATGNALAFKFMLVITCDDLADGDTATLTVWVETEKGRKGKFKPTACLELANDSATPVNEWLTLNPGIKEYELNGSLLHIPVQSIQLQPVSTDGCVAVAP